ncbi:MAG: hypothetical protein AAF447_06280 [Myxococcota bacterium]
MASTPRAVLRPGSPVARTSGAPGCLGALLVRGDAVFGLSAAHVLAGPEPVPPGAELFGPERQPLGRLHAHTPLILDGLTVHRYDLAAFRVAPGVQVDPSLAGFGPPRFGDFDRPAEGQAVLCVGRHGVLRRGRVVAPECAMLVDLSCGSLRFEGLVGVAGEAGAPFSLPGDSGALVVDAESLEALGLLVGGEGDVSVACPLDLRRLALAA